MERKLTMLSGSEINWMNQNYPDLFYEKNKIKGELFFRMSYTQEKKIYIINPEIVDEQTIQDVYEIEIDFSNGTYLPSVRETGGKIKLIKEKWNLPDTGELHMNKNGTLCLCVKTEEKIKLPNGFDLETFFNKLLIPFFYYQSFFYVYGQEPWKGYSHGDLGVLESYENINKENVTMGVINFFLNNLSKENKNLVTNNKTLKGHSDCICGSGKKFRNCHYQALFGYNRLRNDYDKINQGTNYIKN